MSHDHSSLGSKFLARLLAELQRRAIATRDDCVVGKCRLHLDVPFVCISCDDSGLFPEHTGKRPDFLIAAHRTDRDRFHWIVVEVKSKNVPRKAPEQLRAAQAVIASLTPPAPSNALLVPLVLHERGAKNVSELAVRSRQKIRHHGKPRTALARECGSRLSEILATQP